MENEYTEVNRRLYSKPELALGETNQFLDRLEQARTEGLDRISDTTHALGTDVPAFQGGLIGAGPSTVAQYQTPQVNQMVANLRATAQQQALNEQLNNLLAQKQQEYKDAYRNAYTTATTPVSPSGDVDVENYSTGVASGEIPGSLYMGPAGTTVAPTLEYDEKGIPSYKVYDTETGEVLYDPVAETRGSAQDLNNIKQIGSAALALLGSTPTMYGAAANVLNTMLMNGSLENYWRRNNGQ